MIEIHWLLLVFIMMICGCAGFMLFALMTMAKMSDRAIAHMRCPHCQGLIPEDY